MKDVIIDPNVSLFIIELMNFHFKLILYQRNLHLLPQFLGRVDVDDNLDQKTTLQQSYSILES